MVDVKEEMAAIKAKKKPSVIDMQKYIKYKVNVEKLNEEQIMKDVPGWPKEFVKESIKEVEFENTKPRPKRYYVSLKEPLEDGNLR